MGPCGRTGSSCGVGLWDNHSWGRVLCSFSPLLLRVQDSENFFCTGFQSGTDVPLNFFCTGFQSGTDVPLPTWPPSSPHIPGKWGGAPSFRLGCGEKLDCMYMHAMPNIGFLFTATHDYLMMGWGPIRAYYMYMYNKE